MPVDNKHPDYVAMAPTWRQCRDAAGGQKAVHAASTLYLPKLSGETENDYAARLKRAPFFNATWRTIAGLTGMLMRKAPSRTVTNASIEAMLDDVTQSGVSLDDLSQMAAVEGLELGRFGLLVDYPAASTEGMTAAQAEALNLRPKMVPYLAEKIINWATEWLNNKCVLSLVVLEESKFIADPKDEFGGKVEPRWRVLDLADAALDPNTPDPAAGRAYRVRVFRRSIGGADEVESTVFPRMNGKRLSYIPFVVIGVDTVGPEVATPPLVDLVYVNLSHFQSTADVEHGAHKTALPQPWASGLDVGSATGPGDKPGGAVKPTFYMGGSEIWLHPDPNGKFGMLEYTGTGLEAIEKRLERKERYMAVLGARMLEDQKKEAETAETAAMHRSGEQSTLATQGKTVSAGIRTALGWFDEWAGGSGDVEFALNSEFLPARMTPLELTALVNAWQQGTLTSEELFDKFQEGGVVRDDLTFEEHHATLSTEPPRLLAAPPPPPGTGDPVPVA